VPGPYSGMQTASSSPVRQMSSGDGDPTTYHYIAHLYNTDHVSEKFLNHVRREYICV
jgi:hypothetical protein